MFFPNALRKNNALRKSGKLPRKRESVIKEKTLFFHTSDYNGIVNAFINDVIFVCSNLLKQALMCKKFLS